VLLLAACTSTPHRPRGSATSPNGSVVGSSSVSAPSTSASQAPSSDTLPSSNSPTPSGISRAAARTAIGDPVTADLCAAVGLAALRGLGAGLTPSFDARQYPPGCSVTVHDGATSVLGLSVFADTGAPAASTGRTTRKQSGRTVYVYRYDAKTGSCERDLAATGVRLVVDSYPPGSGVPDKALACSGTDAMVNRLAAAVAVGAVPRLSLATPSLSALDSCKIVRKTDITTLSTFAGSAIHPRGFDANCELAGRNRFLFLNFEIADTARPTGSTATTVEGHRLYRTAARGSYCTYVSSQGRTAGGRYEQVSATSAVAGSAAAPAAMCGQTAQALARYLTAAGLS
jgi:hypothetical protein